MTEESQDGLVNDDVDKEKAALRKRQVMSRAKLTISAASRLLRRKIPQSGHLMTPKKLWMQTIPTQDCDVVLTFPPGTEDSTLMWLLSRLRERTPDLVVHVRHHATTGCYGFYLTAAYDVLLRGAEVLHLPKQMRQEFGGGLKEFMMEEGSCFEGIEEENLFLTSQERRSIILHLLNGLCAAEGDEIGGIKFIEGQVIVPKCLSAGIISQVFALHEIPKLEELRRNWVQAFFKKQPLDDICQYFGVKIAIYFTFLGHYTTALVIPALVGCIVWICFNGRDQDLEDIGFVLFAFFNVLWATVYLESWKRQMAELAYRWGTLDQRDDLLVQPRPLFTGELTVSPVTGRLEPTYPAWKRNIFRYFVSIPIIVLCLAVVFIVMFLILELQGWWDKWIEQWGYPFWLSYLPKILLAISITVMDDIYHKIALWLNDMENYRLDVKYENHLIIKVAMFQFVNSFLSLFYIAFYLKDMEKLREQLAALMITRQVIGNIKESALPYLLEQIKMAKISFDMFGALSPSEENKKLIKDEDKEEENWQEEEETCPVYEEGEKKGIQEQESSAESMEGMKKKNGNRNVSQAEIESAHFKYDGTFEDYLEMFIQFGYVILFSSAFPMAALCALLNNLIEIRSDAFKLCCIFQRPFGQRVQNIGTWQDALEVMGVIGVIVNCALIGLSGQVHRMFPGMSVTQTVILIVVLEHIMLTLKFAISYAIPDIPQWVATEMAKVEFKRRETFKKFSANTSPAQDSSGMVTPSYMMKKFFSSSLSATTSFELVESGCQTEVEAEVPAKHHAEEPGHDWREPPARHQDLIGSSFPVFTPESPIC